MLWLLKLKSERERERVTVYIITINALDLIKSVPYLHHP